MAVTERQTNKQFAETLAKLAEFYRGAPEGLDKPILRIYVYGKEELLKWIRAIGGTWTKETTAYDDINFESKRIPGFSVQIPRDRICRKVVTWDCEPLLSKEEEEEVAAVVEGKEENGIAV